MNPLRISGQASPVDNSTCPSCSVVFVLNYLFLHQYHEFPSKLFFFCEVEPASGGETPLVLSHVVYERMKEKYSEFVERLEKHGLLYTRVLQNDDNPASPVDRGWKSTFSTTDKTLAEQRFLSILLITLFLFLLECCIKEIVFLLFFYSLH